MAEVAAAQTFGKFRLLRRLAKGGMAEVHLAQAEGPAGFSKTLVVKRILPHLAEDSGFVQMFLNEARLAALLNHPNVVQIYDLGEQDGSYFIAMEYIDGPSLRALVKRANAVGRLVPAPLAAKIVSLACDGLGYAHDFAVDGRPLQLIHRDISPDNILLSLAGAVKVVDFGIAKAANQQHLTQTGTIKGKIAYMPPEQLRGHPLDRRADIFALGIVLYELLAGMKPFDSTSEVATMQAILNEQPAPLRERRPDCPGELWSVIERALAKNRDLRYPSCRAMQQDLEAFLIKLGKPVGAYELAQLVAELGQATPPSAEAARSSPRPPEAPPPPASALLTRPVVPPPELLREAAPVSDAGPSTAVVAAPPSIAPVAGAGPSTAVVAAPPSLAPVAEAGPSTAVVAPQPIIDLIPSPRPRLEPQGLSLEGSREAATRAEPIIPPGSKASDVRAAARARRRRRAAVAGIASTLVIGGAWSAWFLSRPSGGTVGTPAPVAPVEVQPPLAAAQPSVAPAPSIPVAPPAATAAAAAVAAPSAPPATPDTSAAPPVAPVAPVVPAAAVTRPSSPAVEAKAPAAPRAKPGTKVSPRPASAEPAASARTELIVKTEPACTVFVDGKPAGTSPARVAGLAPGAHEVRVVNKAEGLDRRRTVQVVAGQTTTETVKFGSGTVVFRVRPWAEVQVDGRPRGSTPLPEGLKLYEGEHRIRLFNPELQKEQIRVVWVEPGKETVVKVDLQR